MLSKGMRSSLISGICASSGSLFGKLSMSPNICINLLQYLLNLIYNPIIGNDLSFVLQSNSFIINTFRVLMFILMIITNAFMWTQFTKALNYCSNSMQVIVINTSANFFMTAIYGQVFFKESLSYIWYLGSIFIIIGLLLMRSSHNSLN